MKLRELEQGQLAIVLTGAFEGEIFYRNVAGIHSLSQDRYWPSTYAERNHGFSSYSGPLDEQIELIDKDRLKHLAPTTPVVEVIEVGAKDAYTVYDYAILGSKMAKLWIELEELEIFKADYDVSFGIILRSSEKVKHLAAEVRDRVTRHAMSFLSNGHDLRVLNKKSLTVRDFIHREDGE